MDEPEKTRSKKKRAKAKPQRKHALAGHKSVRQASDGAPEVRREYTDRLGAPRLDFDLDEVYGLGKLMPTHAEVAAFFGCAVETIADRMKNDLEFRAAFDAGKASGRLSFRRKMFQAADLVAEADAPRHVGSVAIFRAKQPMDKGGLDWTDKVETTGVLTLEVIARVAAAAKQTAGTDFGEFAAEGAELPEVRPADG